MVLKVSNVDENSIVKGKPFAAKQYHYLGVQHGNEQLFETTTPVTASLSINNKYTTPITNLVFNINNDDVEGFEKINSVCEEIVKNKDVRKTLRLTPSTGGLRPCVFDPLDENNQPIEDTNPLACMKITPKTSFKRVVGKEKDENGREKIIAQYFDYMLLKGNDAEVIPTFNIRFYSGDNGDKLHLQLVLKSCLILSLTPKQEVDYSDNDEALKYVTSNPDAINELNNNISKISTRVSLEKEDEDINDNDDLMQYKNLQLE